MTAGDDTPGASPIGRYADVTSGLLPRRWRLRRREGYRARRSAARSKQVRAVDGGAAKRCEPLVGEYLRDVAGVFACDPDRVGRGWSVFDEWRDVVKAQQPGDVRSDLEICRVQLVAIQDAGLDPGVDLIEALRQLSQIATACSVGGPMRSSRQSVDLTVSDACHSAVEQAPHRVL